MQLIILFLSTLTIALANEYIKFPESSAVEASLLHLVPNINITLKEIIHNVANIGLRTLEDLLVEGNSNAIVSPINVYSCLGILGLGAAGLTKNEVLYFNSGSRHDEIKINELIQENEGVSRASALFLEKRFHAKQEFVDAALSQYEAPVINFNASDGEKAKELVNRWVSDHTNGTITDLLRERLSENTKMVVVSALTFKGKWAHTFPPEATVSHKFEIEEGNVVDVQLMRLMATVPFLKAKDFDAVGLPYENNMIMYLILPKEHGVLGLKKLLPNLNSYMLKKLKSQAVVDEVVIAVPKVHIEARFSLTNALKKQGVHTMFNRTNADFRNVADVISGLFVSEVYHSINFEMGEEGTIATAATATVGTKSSKSNFVATRPFIFAITDEKGLNLFTGAVINPTVS